ncbi:recombinase family protein [Cytophagaceae bacterium YF14B1]|uniref:Recombinase family protein n=1 Tax=Xanthocytophaga flava TaxID=3048013 RepID=A0AAE3U843_9BACT|nr:recombinase family protein [Xanthocytophaga flavus]MDJ1480289.1 recombinase family protein [Xanthocytophaga flavus]
MKVAIYTRVSTKDQQSENQLIQLQEFCHRSDYTIFEIYTDYVSGSKSEKDRSEFARLMSDATKRKFDLVLFWSLDRFSREGAVKTLHYFQRLEEHSVGFRSLQEPYIDSTGIFKEAIISLLATLAKQERLRISERTKAGLDKARRDGKQIGRKAISEELAAKIRNEKRQGKSNRDIARLFNISPSTVPKYL